MGRILLLLIVALGLGLAFPSSREIIVERARPLMNPALTWMTVQELNQIVVDLEFEEEARGRLPLGRGEFDQWMDQRYPQAGSREDSWGTRYRLELVPEGFAARSAGPDGEFGTEDDIRRTGSHARIPGR
ncbi:MAG: hypothetical protein WD960_13200 [Gemmatimonadota bacterium]